MAPDPRGRYREGSPPRGDGPRGQAHEGSIQFRARSEAYLSPFFLDTGKIPADYGRTTGAEAFYQSGPWMFGGEYHRQTVDAESGESPLFHGGNVLARG